MVPWSPGVLFRSSSPVSPEFVDSLERKQILADVNAEGVFTVKILETAKKKVSVFSSVEYGSRSFCLSTIYFWRASLSL